VTGEDRLIAWLRRQLRRRGEDFLGDDAAVLSAAGDPVVTVDQQIAGVHFPTDLAPAIVARRLMAVGLSDLAAMGAEPHYAFLALTLPDGPEPPPFRPGRRRQAPAPLGGSPRRSHLGGRNSR
jgi:thiamine monophosphate kinase